MIVSWVDIGILVVLAVFIIIGAVKGLVKSICSFLVLLFSFVVTKLYYTVVSKLLCQNTNIDETVSRWISQKLPSFNLGGSTDFFESINFFNVPDSFFSGTDSFFSGGAQNFLEGATENIMEIIAFVGMFLTVYLLCILLIDLIDLIFKLPVLNFLNRSLGALIGAVIGLVCCFVIISGLYYLGTFLGNETILSALNNSMLASYFYLSFLFG